MRLLAAALLLCMAAPAAAEPLTVRVGESWVFALAKGEPSRARKVPASAKPAPGEIKVSVNGLMGTTLTATSNNKLSYTFKAELVGGPSGHRARTCTLPANGRPILENWPAKATAVRIGDFRQTETTIC